MLTNYHSHTYRCHHADGTEEEYIRVAIENGVAELGFSDHSPYPMDGYCSPFRMATTDAKGYVDTLLNLREKYKGKINIYIGFEAEYYPKYFRGFLELIDPLQYDYLILGQHFIGNEIDEDARPSFDATDDELLLGRYVNQVIEAIDTDAFSYIAHPDVFHFVGSHDDYKKHITRLCEHAKEKSVPLEINALGMRDARYYPNIDFWKIAAEIGNEVVYGCDAHNARYAWDNDSYKKVLKMVKSLNLNLIDKVRLHRAIL